MEIIGTPNSTVSIYRLSLLLFVLLNIYRPATGWYIGPRYNNPFGKIGGTGGNSHHHNPDSFFHSGSNHIVLAVQSSVGKESLQARIGKNSNIRNDADNNNNWTDSFTKTLMSVNLILAVYLITMATNNGDDTPTLELQNMKDSQWGTVPKPMDNSKQLLTSNHVEKQLLHDTTTTMTDQSMGFFFY